MRQTLLIKTIQRDWMDPNPVMGRNRIYITFSIIYYEYIILFMVLS